MADSKLDRMAPTLGALPDGTEVAVVTLLGSLCPVTLAHTQGFFEARKILLGQSPLTPAGLERFGEVVGFVSLNSDRHVGRKLEQQGLTSLDLRTRLSLVGLAIEDDPWLATERSEGASLSELRSRWPKLRFVHFRMNGADDVVKYRKWTDCNAACRYITMGRSGDTEKVADGMRKAKVDPSYFLLGPELPEISSTAVRKALGKMDIEALTKMLHPSVTQWCIDNGAYCKPMR